MEIMQPLKAVVRNGRLVVDEPTELPDGTELELVAVEDDLSPAQRDELMRAIDEGAADIARGDYIDGSELIAQLRARREASDQ